MQKETYWLKVKRYKPLLITTGIILIPVAIYFIPLDWIKDQHSICLYKNLTGHECIGCGMTRATLSAIHFQFGDAYKYNKLFIIVFPLLVYIWGKTILTRLSI